MVSGLPTGRFVFEGFLPRKGSGRTERLASLASERRTIVLYEAPHRVARTLADLAAAFGAERRVAIARELTKLHEEVWRGPLGEAVGWAATDPPRGELALVVEGAPPPPPAQRGPARGGVGRTPRCGLTGEGGGLGGGAAFRGVATRDLCARSPTSRGSPLGCNPVLPMTLPWALLIAFTISQVANLVTTLYLHRTLSHRAIALHPVVEWLCRFTLWLTVGIDRREWVSVHRKHHVFNDEPDDPHSPKQKGVTRVLFLNAGYYRIEAKRARHGGHLRP